jgi:hypothetical protein
MSICRPGPVMRKSQATGVAGAARRETPGAAPGARQHGGAGGDTAFHPGQVDDEPAGGRGDR